MDTVGNEYKDGVCLLTGNAIKKALFYESMTEIRDEKSGARIRVWRKEKELPEYADFEILKIFEKIPGGATMQEMADILSSIEGVTAFEMTAANGCGAVVYLEW